MQYRFCLSALIPVFLTLILVCPARVSGADAVEKAFNMAKELVNKAQEEAAQQPADQEPGALEQATYPGIENLHIEHGGNGVPSVSIYYPATGNPAVDAELKGFAEDLASAYEKEVAPSADEGEEKPDSYGTWEETGFFTVERPNPDVISITFNVYTYTGGAHGQILISVQNYDLRNGKRLEFDDLFADPRKALTVLSEISAARLRASLGEDAEEEMIASGTAPEVANFSNLSLMANGLAVEFQPYQVGPWSIGQQHVDISLEELAPAGPSPLVWPPKTESK